MAQAQDKQLHTTKVLGIAYLVWTGVSVLAMTVILLFTTLAYCGIYPVKGELSQTVSALGLNFSVWVFLVLSWVVLGLAGLACIAFGICALTCDAQPKRLRPAIILGRVACALCVVDLLVCVAQADGVTFVASVISLFLTAALALEVRKVARVSEERVPAQTFVAEAEQTAQSREEALEGEARSLHAACSGYASIMLVWGGLRILYGAALLFSLPLGLSQDGSGFAIASSLVIIVVGSYLITTGRAGKKAMSGSGTLPWFKKLCAVGLAVSGAACALFALLMLNDVMPTAGEIFCAIVDFVLCLGALVNTRKLEDAVAAIEN